MLLFDGRRQHDDLACAARRQRKPSLRRAHLGQRPKLRAKTPEFDSQPCTIRFIGVLRPEGACDERAPWRSEEHTSELQSQSNLVCRLLLDKKNQARKNDIYPHRPGRLSDQPACPAVL